MHRVMRARALVPAIVCLVVGLSAPTALGATKFRPRIANGLGLAPTLSMQDQPDLAAGQLQTPVTYHGGAVMSGGVTVHTIFWTGGTNQFNPAPGNGALSYTALIQQFFSDMAAASKGTTAGGANDCTNGTNTCSVFSTLPQWGFETNVDNPAGTPPVANRGTNSITYDATGARSTVGNLTVTGDSIVDADPYPGQADQCASPQQTPICITDQEVQDEIDTVINQTGGARGLHNLWYVFLPGGVDECIVAGACGTNAFGGYHSLSNLGNGLTIYAITPDLSIESRNVFEPGKDPEGNPDAELAIDVAAHETEEAITDPEGVGYMDPNGFEVADKCENGPQIGTVLGNAGPDHAPFNQVINNHDYLLQEMWANEPAAGANPACVQTTTVADPPGLPLPQVDLKQFSNTVSGNIGSANSGVTVTVTLVRAGQPVASSHTGTPDPTDTNGHWSVTLPRAVGDDRDEIDVSYSGPNAPSDQTVFTGNGGNPFGEAGWTGWFDLDNGSALTSDDQQFNTWGMPSLMMGPCFQTGVLAATEDNNPLVSATHGETSPTDFCGTGSDVADMPLAAAPGAANVVTSSSNDNRAFIDPNNSLAGTGVAPNPTGGLVNLTVPVAETDAVGPFASLTGVFQPGGIPSCTADLGAQSVTCSGLVPGEHYTVSGHGADAGKDGTVSVSMPLQRNGTVTLSNGSRTLTTLQVADLRVDLANGAITGGSCSADQYFGAPLTSAPISAAAGSPTDVFHSGSEGTGHICPANRNPAGLPADTLEQTDDTSGGQTVTEVAGVADTFPLNGETMFGSFTALADATAGTPTIALTISHGGSNVFSSGNVDTANGVAVPTLSPGIYTATWTVSSANGDTNTFTTRFVEQPALQGPQGPQGPQGSQGPRGPKGPKPIVKCHLVKHNKIKCTVRFPKHHKKHGIVRLAVSRGGKLVALGHATVNHGQATLTMRELRTRTHGAWQVVVVFSRTVKASTNTVTVSVK